MNRTSVLGLSEEVHARVSDPGDSGTRLRSTGRRSRELEGRLKDALEVRYQLTKTGWDRLQITEPGTVFVLRQPGVRADLATDLTLYADKEDAQIAQAGGLAVGLVGGKETSRSLNAGEELYLFKVDVDDKEGKYQLLTTDTYQVCSVGTRRSEVSEQETVDNRSVAGMI